MVQLLVDRTDNLAHGMDCPAFTRVTVVKGTPDPSTPLPASVKIDRLAHGTIEFRDRLSDTVLASMSTASDTSLNQSVGACRIVVNPDELRPLIRLVSVAPNGRVVMDDYGRPAEPPQTLPLPGVLSGTDQLVRHGYQCPAFAHAVVTKGTAPTNGPQATPPIGEQPLQAGTITFRDRTTKATLATMSTLTGTRLSTPVATCEMVVGPDPRLEGRIEVVLVVPY